MAKDRDVILKQMQDAAQEAKKELDGVDVKPVANWIKKHFPKAGYKNLAKVLVEMAD